MIGRGRRSLAVGAAAAVAAAASADHAQRAAASPAAPPAIAVLREPDDAAAVQGPLTLAVQTGATDAEELVFLRQSSGADLTGVTLISRGLPLSFTQGVDATTSALTLPNEQPVALGIKATDPRPKATGTLFAAIPGKGIVKLVDIVVSRTAGDVIKVAGAAADGSLAITAGATVFDHDIQIRNVGGEREEVTVSVDPLSDPFGAVVPMTVTLNGIPVESKGSATVPEFGRVPLTLAATLEASGPYTTTITVVHDEKAVDVPVTITRARMPPTIALGTVAAAQSTVWLGLLHKADATLIVPLDETGGRPLNLRPPDIVLQVAVGDGQRSYSDFTATIAEQQGQTIPLPPDAPSHLTVQIAGLSPGAYTANLRFHGSSELHATGTIYIRRAAWIAAAAVFLGIVLAELIRYLRGTATQRLERRLAVARAADELQRIVRDGRATEAEKPTIEGLSNAVAALGARLETSPGLDPQEELDRLNERLKVLARWLPLRRVRREVSMSLPEVDTKLARAAAFIGDGGGQMQQANEALDAALASLLRVPNTLARLNTLQEAFERWAVAPRVGAAPPEIDAIRGQLAKARADVAADKLDDAEAAAETAWLAWLKAAADELLALIPETPPQGFDAARWATARQEVAALVDDVYAATTPAAALEAYAAGYQRYVRVLADELDRQAGAAALDHPDQKSALADVQRQAQAARAAVEGGRLAEGWSLLRAAQEVLRQVLGNAGARPELVSGAAALGEQAVVAPPKVDTTASAAADQAEAQPTPIPMVSPPGRARIVHIGRWLGAVRFASTLLVGVGAVLLGVQLLWAPDASWGTTDDIVVAILWGLGLHTAGTETLGGGLGRVGARIVGEGQP